MESIGAYEAKTNLAKLLERVLQGEQFTITKHGVPVALQESTGSVIDGNTLSIGDPPIRI